MQIQTNVILNPSRNGYLQIKDTNTQPGIKSGEQVIYHEKD